MTERQPDYEDAGHYRFDLDHQIETCLQEYEEAMAWFYESGGAIDPELSQAIFSQAQRFADQVLSGTDALLSGPETAGSCSLVAPELDGFLKSIKGNVDQMGAILETKGLALDEFQNVFHDISADNRPQDGTVLKVVWERLLIHAVSDAVCRSRRAATRLLQLSRLTVPAQPSKDTKEFLRRVSRCFVWGFDSECVVMCRGVLDAAFAAAGVGKGRDTLCSRIDTAWKTGLIDCQAKEAATRVRKTGRDTVHMRPGAAKDVLKTIEDTTAVLTQIAKQSNS